MSWLILTLTSMRVDKPHGLIFHSIFLKCFAIVISIDFVERVLTKVQGIYLKIHVELSQVDRCTYANPGVRDKCSVPF